MLIFACRVVIFTGLMVLLIALFDATSKLAKGSRGPISNRTLLALSFAFGVLTAASPNIVLGVVAGIACYGGFAVSGLRALIRR
jgi:hypothetical protein